MLYTKYGKSYLTVEDLAPAIVIAEGAELPRVYAVDTEARKVASYREGSNGDILLNSTGDGVLRQWVEYKEVKVIKDNETVVEWN